MRDGTKSAGAFLRSEIYREARRDVEGEVAAPQPAARGTSRDGAEASSQRARRGPAAPMNALALLGLLDLLTGG